jgi:hypothetical protein
MEPDVSLPCPQEPDTGPYPELDKSSLYPNILFLRPISVLSSYLHNYHKLQK